MILVAGNLIYGSSIVTGQSVDGNIQSSEAKLAVLDAALNDAYQNQLIKHASDHEYLQDLREAQRSWLKYVEHHLKTEFSLGPGENPMDVYRRSYGTQLAERKSQYLIRRIAELGGSVSLKAEVIEEEPAADTQNPLRGKSGNGDSPLNPADKIHLLGLWALTNSNCTTYVTKYRNSDEKTLKALRGTISTLNDFAEVDGRLEQEFDTRTKRSNDQASSLLRANEVFYFTRMLFTDLNPPITFLSLENPLIARAEVKSESDLAQIRVLAKFLRFKIEKLVFEP